MTAAANAKSYATKARSAATVEEKLDHLAKAVYEMARALQQIQTRVNNLK